MTRSDKSEVNRSLSSPQRDALLNEGCGMGGYDGKVKRGSIVTVAGGFGMEKPERVEVTYAPEPHKYAYAFGYVDSRGCDRWAYTHQIIENEGAHE